VERKKEELTNSIKDVLRTTAIAVTKSNNEVKEDL